MRIYPAVHYTMGGLWVDYHLMSTIPGLFVAGEANFSDQGANRLGASALMQGLADGYFILPCTLPNYLASTKLEKVDTSHPAFREAEAEVQGRIDSLLKTQGRRTVDSIHRELGRLMWDDCGMARSEASLRHALAKIPELQGRIPHQRSRAGGGRRAEPVARESRPRRRFSGARRIDVHRRPAPERSRAAATSAWRAKLPRARPGAMTRTSPTSRPGSGPARRRRPLSTRSR